MSYQTKRFNDAFLDKVFRILLKGLEENAELNEKRKIVNSILPVKKYKLLERFLSFEEGLSEDNCLRCLHIFLDENTKFLGFEQFIYDQEIVKSILELILRYSPNIETVDFRHLDIDPENKGNFVSFLRKSTHLKSLRVKCDYDDCAIGELLLKDDFNLLDQDVKTKLLKIEYIEGLFLNGSQCVRLLNLLPNLKGLGMIQRLSLILPIISDDGEISKKLSNITEFHDSVTRWTTLESFSKLCPKTKKISLFFPETKVIENLSKFPLLTEIELYIYDPDFVSEVVSLLTLIGKQIKILTVIFRNEIFNLRFPDEIELGPNTVYELCPELFKLVINDDTFYFY